MLAEARGAFIGLSLHHGRGHLVRSVLEGVAYSVRRIYEKLNELGFIINNLNITGRGGEAPLWAQIIANIMQREAQISTEASVRGAAILAAVGTGYFRDINHAVVEMAKPAHKIKPKNRLKEIYEIGYQNFLEQDNLLFG
jgi:xylulokinase